METLLSYIAAAPTAYHAVAHTAALLEKEGYQKLMENSAWELSAGGRYYVTRNGSSLLAFRVPHEAPGGFMIAAAHGDSPSYKIKENAELQDGDTVRLATEPYGGMLSATWLDRPLSIAGRVSVRTEHGIAVKLVDFAAPVALIPQVAIHMDRSANDGKSYNPAVDMLPLFGGKDAKNTFRARVAQLAGASIEDIISTDLFLYNPQEGVEWGEFVSAPRLDDLQCAYAALCGFLAAKKSAALPVYALFDNEEVGSETKQGAASTFLFDTLLRICEGLPTKAKVNYRRMVANSFLVSCDNAHAAHPNHREYADRNHAPVLNGGVVLKYNANQRYTTDAVSAAIFRLVCERAGVPCQQYANRADMRGGSTLGNIATTRVSLNAVDIGAAQLAMHSAFETAGAKDTDYLMRALTAFYESALLQTDEGYTLL